jgi:glycosyltransferase involved in cell wall biosynthesis
MKVLVVAEYYPRAADPVLGVWAHRQALAARDAGADVRVVVLHRVVAPAARARDPRAWREVLAQPARATLDGLDVRYVRYGSPPRGRAYPQWGAWAAPALAVALRRLRREFAYDLIHAHYAVPAGDAALRARVRVPLVVSEHGGDVFGVARSPAGERAVRRVFGRARLVLANSTGIERAVRGLGARHTRVVHLGADLPEPAPQDGPPTLITVGHLVARKRHGDVLRALWALRERRPDLRYVLVGDGPERPALERLARELGVARRVEFVGQRPHHEALLIARRASLFVMPSTDEAFGVAYVEAMAAGLPAIGARGEPGPEDIAAAGPGLHLVPPGDVEALAAEIDALLDGYGRRLGAHARATVARHFSWEACGRATVAAYEEARHDPRQGRRGAGSAPTDAAEAATAERRR